MCLKVVTVTKLLNFDKLIILQKAGFVEPAGVLYSVYNYLPAFGLETISSMMPYFLASSALM